MKRNIGLLLAALAAVFLLGCIGGSGGSSAPAPTDVQAIPKDNRVVVTWTAAPGVQYWIFKANGSGVTPKNCSSMPLCNTAINATSPYSFTIGISDGFLYSFSVNGRTGGGPGGPGSPATALVAPRPAGATWNTATAPGATAPGANALRGVAFGNAKFVAAGDSNALYSGVPTVLANGTGAITWTDLTSASTTQAPGTKFNAVSYNASPARHFVAGTGGVILQSADAAVTWTKVADSKTTNELLALANNGTGFVVAVGVSGTIVTSSDSGSSWAPGTSGTPNALNGVAYDVNSGRFAAVGDTGTVLYGDGKTWSPGTIVGGTTPKLRAVTNGYDAALAYWFVAVGDNGTILTSPDGVTWTPLTFSASSSAAISTANLTSITYTSARRFVAVSDTGQVFYCDYSDLKTWVQATVPSTTGSTPIYAVAPGGILDYAAVGAGGLNLYAD